MPWIAQLCQPTKYFTQVHIHAFVEERGKTEEPETRHACNS